MVVVCVVVVCVVVVCVVVVCVVVVVYAKVDVCTGTLATCTVWWHIVCGGGSCMWRWRCCGCSYETVVV